MTANFSTNNSHLRYALKIISSYAQSNKVLFDEYIQQYKCKHKKEKIHYSSVWHQSRDSFNYQREHFAFTLNNPWRTTLESARDIWMEAFSILQKTLLTDSQLNPFKYQSIPISFSIK